MRAFLVLLVLSILSGCAGHTKKTAVVVDGEVQRNWYGGIAYNKEKLSRTAVIEDASARKIEAIAENIGDDDESPCVKILERTPQGVADSAEQFRSFSECTQMENMKELFAYALGRPRTDIEAVSGDSYKSIKVTEENQTKRTTGVTSGVANLAIPVGLTLVSKQQSKDRRLENQAGFANAGDTLVNGLSVNTGQTSDAGGNTGGSPLSNDAEGGFLAAEGEAGLPGQASAASPGGDGTGTATNTKTGDTVNLNIGRGTINTVADNGRQFVDTRSTQQLDTSANGGVNDGANVDQQPIVDSASQVDFNNNPCVGVSGGCADENPDTSE